MLLTFRYGLIEIPGKDHPMYMSERGYTENDWQWFRHSMSYSRTRINFTGDRMLFRPALMAMLALQDIFLRRHLLAQGIIGIFIFSLTAYALYKMGKLFFDRWLGLLFAVLFLTQYAGSVAVLWRHFTPQILSLAFMSFGLMLLIRPAFKKEWINYGICVFLNLIATLFHDFALFTLVLAGTIFLALNLMSKARRFPPGLNTRTALVVFLLPVFLSLTLNLADYLYYRPGSILGPAQNWIIHRGFDFTALIKSLFSVLAPTSLAFLWPTAVNLKGITWNFLESPSLIRPMYLCSAFIGIIFFLSFLSAACDYVRGRRLGLSIATLSFSAMFFAFIVALGVGRVYLYENGVYYLFGAPYYYSMSGFVLCGICMLSSVKLKDATMPLLWRKGIYVLVTVAALALISVNYLKIQGTLKPLYPDKAAYAKNIDNIAGLFTKQKRYCLAGYSPDKNDLWQCYHDFQNCVLLWDYICERDDKREPLYITGCSGGNLSLAELRTAGLTPLQSHAVSLEPQGDTSGIILLSQESYERRDFEVTIDKIRDLNTISILFGYEGPGDYLFFEVGREEVHAGIRRGGNSSETGLNYILAKDLSPLKLKVRYAGNEVYLLKDQYPLSRIPVTPRLKGKIGFLIPGDFFTASQLLAESKVEIRVSTGNSKEEKPSIAFEPKFKLPVAPVP